MPILRPVSPADGDATAPILARLLDRMAPRESVRVLEAVAAATANRLRRGAPLADVWRECGGRSAPPDPQRLAVCARIARRALHGGLPDPTGGAVRHHPLGSLPAWACGRRPCAHIGDRLFYRDPP